MKTKEGRQQEPLKRSQNIHWFTRGGCFLLY